MDTLTRSRIEIGHAIPREIDVAAVVRAAVASVDFAQEGFHPFRTTVTVVETLYGAGAVLYELRWTKGDDVARRRGQVDSLVEAELQQVVSGSAVGSRTSAPQRIALHSELIGSGAYSDVWAGTDILGRDVAVKFLRPTMQPYEDLQRHARALAAQDHPTIVRVHSLERLVHPKTNQVSDAIVMARVRGITLKKRLETRFSAPEVRAIGQQLFEGVSHIHGTGLYHGDLHSENVLLDGEQVRIIDILYYDTAAVLSTGTRETRQACDVRRLRDLLGELLAQSEFSHEAAVSLGHVNAGLSELREAFAQVTTDRKDELVHRRRDALKHFAV